MGYRDAEAILHSFYRQVETGLEIGTTVPNPRPPLFVRAWRTGGSAINRVLDAPILTTQVWGDETADTVELLDLANRLRDALYGRLTLIPPARHVEEVVGLYFDPDPDTGDPRYSFAARLRLRAQL